MRYSQPHDNVGMDFDSSTNNVFCWTTQPLLVYVPSLKGYVPVPEGFYHNRASVPFRRFGIEAGAWSFIPQAVHDWLYETGLYLDIHGIMHELPRNSEGRKMADAALDDLVTEHYNDFMGIVWYISVRAGGNKYWKNDDIYQSREWIMPKFGNRRVDYVKKFLLEHPEYTYSNKLAINIC